MQVLKTLPTSLNVSREYKSSNVEYINAPNAEYTIIRIYKTPALIIVRKVSLITRHGFIVRRKDPTLYQSSLMLYVPFKIRRH